ncbi:MAG: helix-turn-helix domain-containing protein [Dissulfuribacterales bacterium]
MKSDEFKRFRKKLGKTQEGMAHLLGISVKAIRSYEQGWRSIPTHAERQLLFLTAKKDEILKPHEPCWTIKNCKEERKEQCPAWEFKAGSLCWFINGTICSGTDQKSWAEKIKICKKCKAFPAGLKKLLNVRTNVSNSSSNKDCFNKP